MRLHDLIAHKGYADAELLNSGSSAPGGQSRHAVASAAPSRGVPGLRRIAADLPAFAGSPRSVRQDAARASVAVVSGVPS